MEESELYPSVKEFIKNKHDCFKISGETGKEGIGYADVFGVYHKNPEKTEIETVGVEVKVKRRSPCANFGQAKGYSVFFDKVYFASLDEFSYDDVEIAKYLGIGLISITKVNTVFVCHEALEPITNKPILRLRDLILERKKILACQSCKVIEQRNYTQTTYSLGKIPKWNLDEVKKGKDLLLKNKGKTEFYCNKCARKVVLNLQN
jgi:hypothetical protein